VEQSAINNDSGTAGSSYVHPESFVAVHPTPFTPSPSACRKAETVLEGQNGAQGMLVEGQNKD
jgi:hypothetical protein